MGIEIARGGLNQEERIEFFRTLAGWLTSGSGTLPVHEAIANTCEVFSRDEYKSFASRMDRIVREFTEGKTTFHQGLTRADIGFTRQELSIIEGAEKSNQLRLAMPSLVDALSMSHNARKDMKKKIVPLVMGGFMLILMSLGVMVFMLPMVLGPVLQRKDDALDKFPSVIKWYWYGSVFMREQPYVPIIGVLIPIAIFFTRNTAFMKPRIERALLKFGPTRRLIFAYNGVLLVYFMPALVRAGIPLPEVVRIMAGSVENITLSDALKVAASEHDNGIPLGEALARLPMKGAFRSAIEAGERTGAVADRVEELKGPFANEFQRIMSRVASTLKMVVMAFLMPFFIMTMYTSLVAPIFALMEF